MNRAVNFYLDASLDNMLIYPWAKIKRHNKKGNPKKQEQNHYSNGWAPAFLYHYKDLYPATIEKTKANPYVQKFINKNLKKDAGSMWGLIDSKCIYPTKDIEFNKIEASNVEYIALVKNKTDDSVIIKVRAASKELAIEEAMKKCTEKHEEGCYVHYSNQVGFGQ